MPAADDPSTPRGYLDLVKERASVAAATGHSGAPSPFAISIKIKADTYWKLCFDNHAVQMEWLAALTDVVVNASVDAYNANLVAAADPSQEATMFSSNYMSPPSSDKDEAGHRLWMTQPYNVSSVSLGRGISDVCEDSSVEDVEDMDDEQVRTLTESVLTTIVFG